MYFFVLHIHLQTVPAQTLQQFSILGFYKESINTRGDLRSDREEGRDRRRGCDRGRTLFYSDAGRFDRWVDGVRLADAADGESMLFVNHSLTVFSVSPDYAVSGARCFIWDGKPAIPELIWDDLRLGFFRLNNQLALAAWDSKRSDKSK